jgi:hypothetical protein
MKVAAIVRKIFPPGSRPEYPESAHKDHAIIGFAGTALRADQPLWNEGANLRPRFISEFHASLLTRLTTDKLQIQTNIERT